MRAYKTARYILILYNGHHETCMLSLKSIGCYKFTHYISPNNGDIFQFGVEMTMVPWRESINSFLCKNSKY